MKTLRKRQTNRQCLGFSNGAGKRAVIIRGPGLVYVTSCYFYTMVCVRQQRTGSGLRSVICRRTMIHRKQHNKVGLVALTTSVLLLASSSLSSPTVTEIIGSSRLTWDAYVIKLYVLDFVVFFLLTITDLADERALEVVQYSLSFQMPYLSYYLTLF